MMELADIHPIAQLLLDRVKWNKYCSSFFAAYLELIDDDDRIHTTFKLHGTTTGRLSSGKENDGEKISAKKQVRGRNVDRTTVVSGKRVSGRVDFGGGRNIIKPKETTQH